MRLTITIAAALCALASFLLPLSARAQEDTLVEEPPPPPPPSRVIDLHVTSEPAGSEVIVAGQVVGRTPIDTQLSLPAETGESARVTVSHEGFQPQTITASTRGAVFVHVSLESIAPPEPAAPPEPEVVMLPGVTQPAYRHEIWGGLGFFGTESGGPTTINTVLEAHARVGLLGDGPGTLRLDLTADWAAMLTSVSNRDVDVEVRALNPLVGVLVGGHVGPVRLMGGVRIGVPLTAAYDDASNPIAGIGYLTSTGMRGAQQLGLTSFSFMETSARGELDYDGGDIRARVDVTVGGLIGVEPDRRSIDDLFVLSIGGSVEGLPHEMFGLGTQVGLTYFTTLGTRTSSELAAFSVAPFARFYFPPGWAGARLLMNMDSPFGFSFDGGIWALVLEGGVRF